nr:reverse transcriptase domain-containing protein [Tanacetum cinerariifolium]
ASHRRLHPAQKAVRDGVRVRKIKSFSERCATKRKRAPRQGGPQTSKAEVEGYLVRRVYVDEGSSVEVMFEHCFENLDSRIKAKLKETQTDLVGVGFAGEISRPLGKIELEVCFGNGGRPGLKTLRAIPSTIHSMMKFLTLKGVATLVTRTIIIAECRRLERRQMVEGNFEGERGVAATEEVLINPLFLDQRVTIGGGLSEACRDQLKHLLKDNMGVFAWEPSDMTGVSRRIVEHILNVNPSMDPVCQKRRTFSVEKSRAVTMRFLNGSKQE